MDQIFEVSFSLIALLGGFSYALGKFLGKRRAPAEVKRLRTEVDEAHHNVRELEDALDSSAAEESENQKNWLLIHQTATRALREYGPEDAYRGQAAPGREELLKIRQIASRAFVRPRPADDLKTLQAIQDFIDGKPE